MGRRVNYEFVFQGQGFGLVLYSNNSHPDVDPEAIFREWVSICAGEPTRLIRSLLSLRYNKSYGRHRAEDFIFVVDMEPGEREIVLIGDLLTGVVTERLV